MNQRLDMTELERIREWVLSRQYPKESALFVFAWACGVCSAAGIPMRELSDKISGPRRSEHAAGCGTESRGCVPGCFNYDPLFDEKSA